MDLLSAISVSIGFLCALLLLSMRVFPRRWAQMYAEASREGGRPRWVWLTIIGSLIGIVAVWYLHFMDGGDYSLAMALLGTFLLARAAQALLSRKSLRQNVQVFLDGKVAATFLPYTIISIVLIVLGLL